MFGKEKNKNQPTPGGMSTISNGTVIQGDLVSDNDLRIDGHILGHIRCNAKVAIGESAVVDGDIDAQNADIFGMVNGNVTTLELLCLKSGCVINGNISVGRLDIEANALFNGKCNMNIPQQQRPERNDSKQIERKQEEQQPPKPVTVIGEDEGIVTVQQQLL